MNLTPKLKSYLDRAREAHPDLPVKAVKVARAIVKAPHTLLKLPCRHTLTFWRALIVLVGLGVVYCGVEEAKLRWHCPKPLELTAAGLAENAESPLWARVSGLAPHCEVAVEASEAGSFRGVWLPLVSPNDPTRVVAVLRAPDRNRAASLQNGKLVSVEGLAYYPRPDEVKNLSVYLHWLDRPALPNLRILDLEWRPGSIPGIALYFLLGLGIFAAAFVRYRQPAFTAEELAGEDYAEEPMMVVFDEYRSEPLPEECKVEVHHMLDHAWSEVEKHA